MAPDLVTRLRGGPLGQRDFRLLWVGQAVSTVGDQVFPVAVTVAVLDATGNDAGAVGAVLAARFAALVVFVVVGGVWADRVSRKAVMIASMRSGPWPCSPWRSRPGPRRCRSSPHWCSSSERARRSSDRRTAGCFPPSSWSRHRSGHHGRAVAAASAGAGHE